ncbi:MAG: efflux RND transporter periplasmic adaptor subunit [Myxococcaceae bacterium]|nr:efflux RND transporter periplasmic adaptor subunit [Myxococcaceae bacterium]
MPLTLRRLLVAVAALCALGALSACSQSSAGGTGGRRGPMKFPVEVIPVTAREVQYAVDATGTVEAFEQVQVTARVQGVVEKVAFAEGAEVKKGQVLAEVEPERYRLAVAAAQAAFEKAQAEREEAEAAAARREAVQKQNPGLIPGEELESFRTRARTAQSAADAAKVAVDQAKLNLRDAYVRAPADGIIETRTVQTGQYVQPGTVLATLVRRDPLLLRFKVPELDAPNLKVGMTATFTTRDHQEPYQATITHVAQAADPKTRMVAVTAEVVDPRRASLRPGAFAEVVVPVRTSRAPVVPQNAARPSEKGFIAYVVDDRDVAHERIVQLGLRTADGQVEVKSGIAEGERLVVRGNEALRDGAQVTVARVDAPPPEASAGAGGATDSAGARGAP